MAGRNIITIDDGTKEITIENSYGVVLAHFFVRPSDLTILERFDALKEGLLDVIKPLAEISIRNDGDAATPKDVELLATARKSIIDQLNRFFDTDGFSDVFAARSPFASVGGMFFVEVVLNGLTGEMTRLVNEERELSKKRMEKYLDDIKETETGADVNAAGPTA